MHLLPLIEAKRDGGSLTEAQIRGLIAACATGEVEDYQLAALLMAVFFQGLNGEETRALMLAMRDSGERLSFPADPRPLVDKHSTGGVGDKVSLVLAPLLASLGFRVPMISGRGLGITGGTLDKLDSIPGFQTVQPADQIVEIVQAVGCCLAGQTDTMVPADRRLYALRDVTGTVPSIPLITASILSKKLAESIGALVLDVKFGPAAFMKDRGQARELAGQMVAIATECGVNTRAVLTDMSTPTGRAAGNWLEVKEAVACLECQGPDDLQELVLHLAASLLVQTGKSPDLDSALNKAGVVLASGKPREKWNAMLAAQGADMEAFEARLQQDSIAPVVLAYASVTEGFVAGCAAQVIGEIVRDLGGGRFVKDDRIQPDVGIDQLAKPGEAVVAGQVLGRIHARTPEEADRALVKLKTGFSLSSDPVTEPPGAIQEWL